MKLRAKFIFVISFAFSMPLFAGKIKTQFQDEPLRANQVSGGLVSVSEDGSQNAKDVPLRVTRAGIVRTPKENIFGQIVPDVLGESGHQLFFLHIRSFGRIRNICTFVICGNGRGRVI